jgi:hypothetical protein
VGEFVEAIAAAAIKQVSKGIVQENSTQQVEQNDLPAGSALQAQALITPHWKEQPLSDNLRQSD